MTSCHDHDQEIPYTRSCHSHVDHHTSLPWNRERFPADFAFELTREEIMGISQIVTSSNLRFSKRVTVFTEQGVAMLSSMLRSKRDISPYRDHARFCKAATNARLKYRTHIDWMISRANMIVS